MLCNAILAAPVFAWTVSATFEKFPVGPGGGDQNLGQGDGLYGSNSRMSVTTSYAHSGTKSLQIFLPGGTENTWQNEFRLPASITDGGEVWARFYVYVPADFDWTSNPIMKLFRFAVVDAVGGGAGFISILTTRPSNYGCTGSPDNFGYIVGGAELLSTPGFVCQNRNTQQVNFLTPGVWHALELYVKASSSGTGIFRIWHQGELIWEHTGLSNIPVGGSIFSGSGNITGHFLGWWNGGVPKDQYIYFDDIAYTNTIPAKRDASGNPMIGLAGGANPPAPTVTLSASPASVAYNASSTITWSSSNAATCAASGAWSGGKAPSGVATLPALTTAAVYTLTCTGAGGSTSQSANITVAPPPPPPATQANRSDIWYTADESGWGNHVFAWSQTHLRDTVTVTCAHTHQSTGRCAMKPRTA